MVVKNRIFGFLILLLAIGLVFQSTMYAIEKPPFPNFKNNVDYVNWLRDQLKCKNEENAREEYSLFFNDPNDPMPRLVKPYKSLREQIDRIISEPRLWAAEKLEDLNEYLSILGPFFDAYIAGTQKKCFCIGIPEEADSLIDITLPHLENSKILTRAMIVQAWKKNHFCSEGFAGKIGVALKHAYHINKGTTLAEYLAASYEKNILYDSILAALNQNILDSAATKNIKVFLRCFDSDNVCNKFADTLFIEQASYFDMLQQMTRRKLLSITFQPKFDRKEIRHWLNVFGYFDESFNNLKTLFPESLLSEDPKMIAQKIEGYYTACRALILNGFNPNYNTVFQDLNSKYFDNYIFFEIFPMIYINMNKYYERTFRLERKRKMVHLGICLLNYYHENKEFPDMLDNIQSVEEKSLLRDPLTGLFFGIKSGKNWAAISCQKIETFNGIIVRIYTDR